MNILILDNEEDKLGNEIVKALILNKEIKIDILSIQLKNTINDTRINYIQGIRNSNNSLKKLKLFYDVIIDLNALTSNDIKFTFQEMNFNTYILKSTYQVYNFLPNNIITTENLVDNDYCEKVFDLYLDININKKEIYAREKLKCETELQKLSYLNNKNFIIIRPSKIYSTQDKFLDVNWLKRRIDNDCPILFKESDIINCNLFNPIYIMDLVYVITQFILSPNIKNEIYNVCQDELITLIDLYKTMSLLMKKEPRICIVDNKYFENEELFQYQLPIPNNRVLSNEKIKQNLCVNFNTANVWMKEILSDLIIINSEKINNYKYEKKYFKKYTMLKDRMNMYKVI